MKKATFRRCALDDGSVLTGFTRVDLAPYPALVKYVERIGARPKVQEALQAEGLLKKAA